MRLLSSSPRMVLLAFLLTCLFHESRSQATVNKVQSTLYLDPAQPVETRVQDLISQLTLEEKATLLNHRAPLVSRFNIRSDGWNQCLHGVWWNRPTTMFPVPIA